MHILDDDHTEIERRMRAGLMNTRRISAKQQEPSKAEMRKSMPDRQCEPSSGSHLD